MIFASAVLSLMSLAAAFQAPAFPLDPIDAILDAFQHHSVVALGEGNHGNEQGHAFRLALIRDPRFAATVNDIVVEVGNARYQDVMDRFVRGEAVADEELWQAWRNTTQPTGVTDLPIYEAFYRAVRSVNASLPRERQLRVLLGDPPMNWDAANLKQEHQKQMLERDTYPADLIEREVLAKHRRALVIYGDMHLQRKQLLANYESEGLAQTVVSRLETVHATKVFTIYTNSHFDLHTLQPDVASWQTPSLALVRGTALGAADFTVYYPFKIARLAIRDGALLPIPENQWRSRRMEDQFDAVLYLGPKAALTQSRLPPALCADAAYMKMRLGRIAELGPPPEVGRLETYCASVLPK